MTINFSNFPIIFVCKFGRVEAAAQEKNYSQMHEKLEKLTERLLIPPTFFNLGEYNLLPTRRILTLRFINIM